MTQVTASPIGGTSGQAATWAWMSAPTQTATAETVGEFRHAFRIGARWILIPLGMPAEVYPRLPCARLPFSHPWCLGLASFRGDLAPVYDLGALLSAHAAEPGRYFLLLGRRDACAALGIDEIIGMTVAPDTPTVPLPPLPGLPSALANRSLAVDGIDYLEIDLVALLGILAERASLLAPGATPSKDYP